MVDNRSSPATPGMTDQLVAGADALRDLMKRINDQADDDLDAVLDDNDCPDLIDYRAMAQTVDESIAANLTNASGDFREGFLRALTDLILAAAGGSAIGDDWDPLPRTQAAFSAPLAMRAAIDAARR